MSYVNFSLESLKSLVRYFHRMRSPLQIDAFESDTLQSRCIEVINKEFKGTRLGNRLPRQLYTALQAYHHLTSVTLHLEWFTNENDVNDKRCVECSRRLKNFRKRVGAVCLQAKCCETELNRFLHDNFCTRCRFPLIFLGDNMGSAGCDVDCFN